MDTGYGSADMLGWLVEERGIAPHIPVWDKSKRTDGTLSREDFVYDPATDSYTCPAGKELRTYRRNFSKPRKPNGGKDGFIRYRASKHDCDACPLKPQCCPGDPGRRVMQSVHEAARDVTRDIRKTDAYMTSFIQRRIRRVPARSDRPKPQEAHKTGSATKTTRQKGTALLL